MVARLDGYVVDEMNHEHNSAHTGIIIMVSSVWPLKINNKHTNC